MLFTDGQDPVALPHEVQALPGNKFAPRILSDAGDYYVRVRANHPEYKLRHASLRSASLQGSARRPSAPRSTTSWRRAIPGSPTRRGAEAGSIGSRACIRKHRYASPAMSAISRSARSFTRPSTDIRWCSAQQLKFLSDRFYNNPRPFYGFEQDGAVWARVISAPANVLSRMSHLMDVFETQISREPQPAYHRGIDAYLESLLRRPHKASSR